MGVFSHALASFFETKHVTRPFPCCSIAGDKCRGLLSSSTLADANALVTLEEAHAQWTLMIVPLCCCPYTSSMLMLDNVQCRHRVMCSASMCMLPMSSKIHTALAVCRTAPRFSNSCLGVVQRWRGAPDGGLLARDGGGRPVSDGGDHAAQRDNGVPGRPARRAGHRRRGAPVPAHSEGVAGTSAYVLL